MDLYLAHYGLLHGWHVVWQAIHFIMLGDVAKTPKKNVKKRGNEMTLFWLIIGIFFIMILGVSLAVIKAGKNFDENFEEDLIQIEPIVGTGEQINNIDIGEESKI